MTSQSLVDQQRIYWNATNTQSIQDAMYYNTPTGGTGGGNMPAGGVAGQLLMKNSGTDYDSGWKSDLSLPNTTVVNGCTFSGGVVRKVFGEILDRTYTQTAGGIFTQLAVGSNGVDITTLNGSQNVNVLNTRGSPPNGGTVAVANRGSFTYATCTQGGTTFNNCTYVPGSSTGTPVMATNDWVTTQPSTDPMLWTALEINQNPTVNYDPGSAVGGPTPYTKNASGGYGAAPATSPRAIINMEGTMLFQTAPSIGLGLGPAVQMNMVFRNDPTINAPPLIPEGFVNGPQIVADTQAMTWPLSASINVPGASQFWHVGFWDSLVSDVANGGSLSGLQAVSYTSNLFLYDSTNATFRVGFYFNDTSINVKNTHTPTLTTQVGLLIGKVNASGNLLDPVTKPVGATNNLGIVNASTTVWVPDAQTVTAGFTVTAKSTSVRLTSAGAVSAVTASAVIASPIAYADGTMCVIVNANTNSANTMTFTTGGSTNLILGGITRVLGAGGSLSLKYSSVANGWVEIGFSPGNGGQHSATGYLTTDGTASHGSALLSTNGFGSSVSMKGNSNDGNPSITLSTLTTSLAFGPGGGTGTDVTAAARSGANGVQYGGSGKLIAFYGGSPVAQQTRAGQLTGAFGTTGSAIVDVGSSFSQANINNNFRALEDAYNRLETIVHNVALST
jgi:hypothetical protein